MNLHKRPSEAAAWTCVAASLALAVVTLIVSARWAGMWMLAGFAAVSVFMLLGKQRVPPLFTFLFALVGLLNGAGYAWRLFERPGPFDEIAHLFTCFAVTLTMAYATYASVRLHFRDHLRLFVLTVTSFGVSVGVAWEWFEWLIGIINSLQDTLMDLLMDAAGALLAGLLSAWAVRREPSHDAPAPPRDG